MSVGSASSVLPRLKHRAHRLQGPTEASINVTLRKHPKGELGSRLGLPIPTASMLVLHPTEPRAIEHGFPGELALGGVQVARG